MNLNAHETAWFSNVAGVIPVIMAFHLYKSRMSCDARCHRCEHQEDSRRGQVANPCEFCAWTKALTASPL